MEYRKFGNTGLTVSVLGFGAGHIGSPEMEEKFAERLLHQVLDSGVTLIDTARSYGESERRIGEYLAHRRDEFILSTKVGYTFSGYPDWSYEATIGTVNEALKKLKTDVIDIVHLHSCDQYFLEQGETIDALEKAKAQGKIRVIAYSGENEALSYAIDSRRFGSIQCSVNLFDQRGIDHQVFDASQLGMGIIAKRPIANAVWKNSNRPDSHGHAIYWDRMQQMPVNREGLSWEELMLRFAAFSPGISSVIVGTANIEHLRNNCKILDLGPLSSKHFQNLRDSFHRVGSSWTGLI